ncbi:Fur family transcriptional regulator [Amycolatopsis jiangsuensis]|uniref:Fur family ferric uptake transcriptional regulator n=1 Tax=Amycolatopsis jiangsuensis TaxID=1181879 RepID=A0A840IV45_9PSEU|nr:transcriptional repressor [Amycolatopsis jiangsuensis]MBB4685072.1 Fur family ferric uptake transcriptional regulator [Amycolatopsis jiangsuensis]
MSTTSATAEPLATGPHSAGPHSAGSRGAEPTNAEPRSAGPFEAEPLDAVAQLRRAGLRVTTARQVVLETLAEHPHCTVAELLPQVRHRLPMVSTRAVHDVLTTGVTAGLVRRFDHVGVAQRYEPALLTHQHLVCGQCGRLDAVPSTADPSGEPVAGLCSRCSADGRAHTRADR